MSRNKTVAVTGANGFLGRYCLKKAAQMGIAVKAIIRRPEAMDIVEESGATTIVIEHLDKGGLVRALAGCDGVLHFIGIVSEQYGSFQEVNVGITRRVLESAYENHVTRFVVPTGLGVDQYGKRPWATDAYFASKKRVEEMCQSSPVPYVIFRPSYILGPGDEMLPSLIESILQGTVRVAGKGDTPMQPLFVEDAATAFLRAATGFGTANSIYDLVGSEVVTFAGLILRVADIMRSEGFTVPDCKVMNVPLEDVPEVLGLSKEEADVMRCDILGDAEPFTRDFQLSPSPLDDAIRAVVRAVKEERKV